MRYVQYLILSLLSLLVASCDGGDYEGPSSSALVVEGWIEDGDFPVVILTKSLPITSRYQQVQVDSKEYLVRWAKVVVSDGQDSVVLTGKYDKGYFPPYVYTTGKYRGKAGKTYRLTVDYYDFHATATTTIPAPVTVNSFQVERVAESDTLYQLKANICRLSQDENYFQFFVRTNPDSRQYLASYLGSIDNAVLDSSSDIPVNRGHDMNDDDYTPYFSVNDTVSVKFAHVDEASFHFWDDYTKAQSLSGNMFLSSSSPIRSNIVGGLGYWCGYGASTYHLVMREYAK